MGGGGQRLGARPKAGPKGTPIESSPIDEQGREDGEGSSKAPSQETSQIALQRGHVVRGPPETWRSRRGNRGAHGLQRSHTRGLLRAATRRGPSIGRGLNAPATGRPAR